MSDKVAVETNRLDRIENKIDELSKAMVALARAEEKIANVELQISAQLERQNTISKRVNVVETALITHQGDVQSIKKMFWTILVVIVIGGLATLGVQSSGLFVNKAEAQQTTITLEDPKTETQ